MAASVDNYERLSSFCYKGLEPSLPHFWSSASLKLELDGTDYQVKLNADLIGKYATFFSGLHWIQSDIGGKACPGKRNCLDLHSGRAYGLHCMQYQRVDMHELYFFPAALAFQRL